MNWLLLSHESMGNVQTDHVNNDVSTYGLLGQMAGRQESAMSRKFEFTHRNKPKHSQANLRLFI